MSNQRLTIPLALVLLALPASAMAQHDHHAMPAPAPVAVAAPAVPAASDEPQGTDQPAGSANPPPIAHDRAADRFWNPARMAAAEHAMMDAHSAPGYSAARIDLAEIRFGTGAAAYHWEGEAWTGDLNRLVLRSRGEGSFDSRLEQAEVEAAYSRAISPWWNLQAGLRQDIRPTPARSHAMLAIEGLAPYKFHVLAATYLSDKGQLTARIEASVDQHITRKLIAQPRVEIELSAQNMPNQRLGSGLSSAEFGLRLRYEITRKFAPYVGVSWNGAIGKTGDYRRAQGESASATSLVLGIKSWF